MTSTSATAFRHACRLRVRYAETDTMGVVYYGNYLTYFEVARVDYLRAIGAGYRELEDEGFVAAVTEAHCKYLAPARFDDLLEIKVRISALRGASMSFAYEVWRPDDQRQLAEGSTSHACLNRDTLRPRALPLSLRECIRAFEGEHLL